MYVLLALIVSLIFAFALSSYYSFIVVLAITFGIVLFTTCFIHTLADGSNKAFFVGCKLIGKTCNEDYIGVWFFFFWAFIYFWLFVSVLGGIVLSPIWYFISHVNRNTSSKVFLILSIILMVFAAVVGITLLIEPGLIYKLVHYGWIIGVFIAITVFALIVTIVLKAQGFINKGCTATLCVGSILLIPLMIFGVVLSMNSTYSISSAEDMKIFVNSPVNYNTVFVVENDIDFEGKDISWFGARDEFEGVFDGQGHVFSNIIINKKEKAFVNTNKGVIRNIVFDSCVFPYKGDYAMAKNNQGKIINCNIMDVMKFNNHKYKIIDVKMSWEDAQSYCESQGGHLVAITSSEEQDFVSSLVQSYNKACWIGAYNPNGNWAWVTGEEFAYSNWDDGEPSGSHSGGETEKYVGIYANNTATQYSTTGKWNDFRGSSDTIGGFVCEWDS